MSTDVQIQLPLWIQTEHLLLVIAKSLGHPMLFQGYSGYQPKKDKSEVDFTSPSKSGNNWSISFANSPKLKATSLFEYGTLMCEISFTDPVGQNYMWFYHAESNEETHKILGPKAYAESIAIGKKLVDFFGGTLLFSDSLDDDDPDNVYHPAKPIYPKRRKTQDSDDRYFQFYNALKAFPALTPEDLDWASEHASYDNSTRIEALKEHLTVLANQANLEASLPKASAPMKAKAKL